MYYGATLLYSGVNPQGVKATPVPLTELTIVQSSAPGPPPVFRGIDCGVVGVLADVIHADDLTPTE